MIFRYSPFRYFPGIKALEERQLVRTSVRRFHSGRLPRTVLIFLLPILSVFPVSAQETVNEDNSYEPVQESTIVRPAVVFYKPNNRRDPFLNLAPPKTSTVTARENVDTEVPRGTPPPGIEGAFIDKVGLEGVVVHDGNRYMAIIRGEDNRAYFLREGDRLFDGYLKAIGNDSVVFVRETFMRSGKLLTQEVTKRLRQS